MPKNISWRNLVQKFRKLGFGGPYSGSRHFFMVKDTLKVRIPNNHGDDISKHLVSEILKQADIAPKDWNSI